MTSILPAAPKAAGRLFFKPPPMLIGVLSDTHGHYDTTRRAVELLRKRKPAQLIHCGDVGSPHILELLTGIPAAFVYGNTDADHDALQHTALALGIQYFGPLGRLTLDGAAVTFLHGDDHRRYRQILLEQDTDFLLHGHTHLRDITDVGKIRVVNPGALHRAHVKTVALLDTASRDVEFLEVD